MNQENVDYSLRIGFMNIRGQTGLPISKQIQIEAFIIREKLDILHLQEINISEDSFTNCKTISNGFSIISNNAVNKYGTATIIKSELSPENLLFDTKGRVIVFDIGGLTLANMYLPSGSDAVSKAKREEYFSTTLPQLLVNRQDAGCIGGDLNCIINKQDCTNYASSKMSQCLAKLVGTFNLTDSFRCLHPRSLTFSHFYHTIHMGQGASRLDRSYHWGTIRVNEAKYEPVPFSDHLSHVVSLNTPASLLMNALSKIKDSF